MESHLLQMRGLKLAKFANGTGRRKSHLLQMRGLKPSAPVYTGVHCVASFTDAWIETINFTWIKPYGYVASFTDAWIET